MTARNPYFTAASGTAIDLVQPRVADVNPADLPKHLSKICRFGGACEPFYSVAEHCVRGLRLCQKPTRPYWLLHDAHEAFAGDEPTPKKRARPLVLREKLLGLFPLADVEKVLDALREADREFEQRQMEAVHRAFGLEWPVPADIAFEIEFVDRVMLITEWRAYMPGDVPEEYRELRNIEINADPDILGLQPYGIAQAEHYYAEAMGKLLPRLVVREVPFS